MTNRRKRFERGLLALLLLQALTGFGETQTGRKTQRVLLEIPKPYDRVASAITARGGRVTSEFKYVDGIAAEIPVDAMEAIRLAVGPTSMSKDIDVARPRASGTGRSRTVAGQQTGPVVMAQGTVQKAIAASDLAGFANTNPGAYSLNNAGTRIDRVHAQGFTGKGTVIAMLDSGVRPGFALLDGAIVGGIDFVDDGPTGPAGDTPTDWSRAGNDGHGTFGAGLIAGNGLFTPPKALKDALTRYAPGSLDNGKLTLIGTAPQAKIYVVRVFGETALQGANLSVILDAIQHVIDLREEYDRTNGRRGIRVDVCNLSLGVTTLNAGRSLLDKSVDALLQAGIIPVVSVGNTGPSPLTTASPGSSMSGVTVGGITQAVNERILLDIAGAPELGVPPGPGVGAGLRPFSGTPVAWFSSRGPNADGRIDPDVVASSVANFGQGYCPTQEQTACAGKISLASGTSFSAPIVSGIAAALRDAFPKASATEIRNAIIDTARTGQFGLPLVDSGATVIDRGQGLPDALAAFNLLAAGRADDSLRKVDKPHSLVRKNVEKNTDLDVHSGHVFQSVTRLRPGAHGEILYDVTPGTEQVIVQVKNVVFSANQNPVIGDALFVDVHSAKTSSIGAFGDYLLAGFPMFEGMDKQFAFSDPDTGIIRITISGDTLNAGLVSADVIVSSIHETLSRVTRQGTIRDEQTQEFKIRIPSGSKLAEFMLTWGDDWAHYPTSDMDLILFAPGSNVPILEGSSLAGPERVAIQNPPAGDWRVQVDGFDIPNQTDSFQLRVTVDGKILK